MGERLPADVETGEARELTDAGPRAPLDTYRNAYPSIPAACFNGSKRASSANAR
jgi:hypothetical protein